MLNFVIDTHFKLFLWVMTLFLVFKHELLKIVKLWPLIRFLALSVNLHNIITDKYLPLKIVLDL